VNSYLVETYLPRSRAADAAATGDRARAAADELARAGRHIRFVRTTFLPDDETCFHLFEAASAALVEEAVSAASLGHARVHQVFEEPASGPR
jgi:hypothetical protein